MSNNSPHKAVLSIKNEVQLTPDRIGTELGVVVLDKANNPISGQPFLVHADSEVLIEGITDERGEFSGQRVINVQEGIQRKVYLTLEGSPVTDWKFVGNQSTNEKQQTQPRSDYVFGARMQGFTTIVKLPSHNLQIDENAFLKLLAGCTSLSLREKLKIIDTIWEWGQTAVDELIRSLSDEFTHFQDLSRSDPKHNQKLKDREDEAEANWRALERFFWEHYVEKIGNEDSKLKLLEDILAGIRGIKDGEEFTIEEDCTVSGDIQVEKGGTLIIKPGTTVRFKDRCGLICEGRLVAVGTETELIIFCSHKTQTWANLAFFGEGAQGSQLEYCRIENGGGRKISDSDKRPLKFDLEDYPPDEYDEYCENRHGGALLFVNVNGGNTEALNQKIRLYKLVLKNNKARKGGGIFSVASSLVILDVCLESNEAVGVLEDGGGGGYFENCDVTLESSTVKTNQTRGSGGGLAVVKSSLCMKDSLIHSNNAQEGGSGIFIKDSACSSSGVSFTRNGSDLSKRGGAICTAGETNLDVYGGEITDNQSKRGGGIFSDGGTLHFSVTVIARNTASRGKGGGLYVTNGAKIKLDTVKILQNSAVQEELSYESGGGGALVNYSELEIMNSDVTANRAPFGGALRVTSSTIRIENSNLCKNIAEEEGGAIQANDSTVLIENSKVSYNSSRGAAGAIVGKKIDLEILHSEVMNNTSGRHGAISQSGGGKFKLVRSKVKGNSGGRAIHTHAIDVEEKSIIDSEVQEDR